MPSKKTKAKKRGVVHAHNQNRKCLMYVRSNICRHAEQNKKAHTKDRVENVFLDFFVSLFKRKKCFFSYLKIDPITKANRNWCD